MGLPVGDRDAEDAVGDVGRGDCQPCDTCRVCLFGIVWIWSQLRASVMKSPPKFLRGAYRSAIGVALTEADLGHAARDELQRLIPKAS